MVQQEQLAVIRSVRYGVNDRDVPVLTFTTWISEHGAADHQFSVERATGIIAAYRVRDVRDLDGRVCWVTVDDQRITYVRPAVF